ncbi:MAG: RNA 3'-terminal phosphate cyclase [Burkholderiales bacterium]|nr:RNA 3'-terminal phosphate cyclase [Burkholderiales bacterium]
MIELDGSHGEGGGQILRSALSLSMITGQPFRIKQIRAKRSKPGLLRQHMIAVEAAAEICGATVATGQGEALKLGATELEFTPGKIKGGCYEFAIGSAGSTTLVLQTILPALLFADSASEVRISGGTHNAMAPPTQFLQKAYGRVLAQMGVSMQIELERFGFYPAGGGKISAHITPCPGLQAISLVERGDHVQGYAESFIAAVPFRVAERELACVAEGLNWQTEQLLPRGLPADQGPGNVLLITLEHGMVTEIFCSFGERNVSSETVAKHAINEARRYLSSEAALGEYLADQVMLPFALAGGGSFSCTTISDHMNSNAMVIEKFLPVKFEIEKQGKRHICTVNKLR